MWGYRGSTGDPIISLRWTPHPVMVTIRDNKGHIRVLLYSYYATITGWGVLLKSPIQKIACWGANKPYRYEEKGNVAFRKSVSWPRGR